MTGCIDRKTGKVTIVSEGRSAEEISAIVKHLLSAANVVAGGGKIWNISIQRDVSKGYICPKCDEKMSGKRITGRTDDDEA